MTTYRRTTRLCQPEELRPELAQIIQRQLSDLSDEVQLCCETTADKLDDNRLAAWLNASIDNRTHLALVLTPDRLIWARSGDHTPPVCAHARLVDLRIKVVRPRHTRDFALDIYGRMAGTDTRAGGQLLLGPEPDAEQFCLKIGEVMQRFNPPRQNKRPKWWPTWWPGKS